MGRLARYLNSSIGKKQIMAVTGLGLSLFLLEHMAGNLLILVGPEAYNAYGHAMTSNKLFLYTAEAGLVALFLAHILLALNLTWENRRARTGRYVVSPRGKGKASMAAKSMIYTGLLTFVFVVLHLKTFKYGPSYTATYEGVEMRDLYQLILEVFRDRNYVIWYVVAVSLLGFHLNHGVNSTFQSLGWNHPNINCCWKRTACCFSILVTVGFLAVPIMIFLRG